MLKFGSDSKSLAAVAAMLSTEEAPVGASLEEIGAAITALGAEAETLRGQVAGLNAAAVEAGRNLDQVVAERAGLLEQVTALKAAMPTEEEMELRASAKAAEIVAGLNVPAAEAPAAGAEADEPKDGNELYAEYRRLKAEDPAKANAFWNAHGAEIKAAVGGR